MKATLSTRKPVDALTWADLSAYPVWEFALDEESLPEQDETWVKPVPTSTIPVGAYSQIVACEFTTASGATAEGFLIVTTARAGWEVCSGVWIHGWEQIPLDDAEAISKAIGADASRIFPLKYRTSVPLEGEEAHRCGEVSD